LTSVALNVLVSREQRNVLRWFSQQDSDTASEGCLRVNQANCYKLTRRTPSQTNIRPS